MKDLHRAHPSRWRLATWLTSLITLFLAFFEFVPVFVALQAGIAGISLALFLPLLVFAGFLAYTTWRQKLNRTTLIALLSAVIALLGALGPMTGYWSAAQKAGVSLTFNPFRYLTFTGDSIAPVRTVVYKTVSSQQLKLAVYGSDTDKPRPTVLLVHGGGWQYGNYQRINNWPKLLSGTGYQVISIEYRLATPNQPTWDKAPRDIGDAVAFVKKNAESLGVQPDKLALFGQSAGGHLALLEANTSLAVRAVVGLYSPTDLAADYELSVDKDAELAFIGGSPSDQPDRYRAVSVPPALTPSAPATLLIQGTSDNLVHHSSSIQLAEQLGSFGTERRLVLIPYTGHSFDNQIGGFATQIAEQAVLDFLANTLR